MCAPLMQLQSVDAAVVFIRLCRILVLKFKKKSRPSTNIPVNMKQMESVERRELIVLSYIPRQSVSSVDGVKMTLVT